MVLFMAPTVVVAINIGELVMDTVLNIPLNQFGQKIPPLSNKMRSSLRKKFSDLKVIIIDEISVASNDLLFYVHFQQT